MKMPKFGLCAGQPRGSLEAGIVVVSKEEVGIIDRTNNFELDFKDKIKEKKENMKCSALREQFENKAIEARNKANLLNAPVETKQINKIRDRDSSIKVTGFHPKTDEEKLAKLFDKAGPVKKVFIPKDSLGRRRNFAIIDFDQSIHVALAVKMFNDTDYENCVLDVKPANDA